MDFSQAFHQSADGTLSLQSGVVGTIVVFVNKAPTGTAVLLAAANKARVSISIRNIGTVDTYIGASGVATTTGYPLLAGEELKFENTSAAFYGITASGTADIRICEITK